jgi:hypothetical protein
VGISESSDSVGSSLEEKEKRRNEKKRSRAEHDCCPKILEI